MTAVSDVMALTSSLALSETPVRPSDVETPPATSLDDLPLEILMEIASSLDCRSLLSLERVSERCRDAVALHLERVNVFNIKEEGNSSDRSLYLLDAEWRELSRPQRVTLLSRLSGLRELCVFERRTPSDEVQWLLERLVAVSTGWSRLEKLTLYWWGSEPDPSLLGQLCSNCTRLSDVSLQFPTQPAVEAVLAARHRELRRLELVGNDVPADRLAAGLSDCVRLETLHMKGIRGNIVTACLPLDGLPALRHLSLTDCDLTDSDLAVAGGASARPGDGLPE